LLMAARRLWPNRPFAGDLTKEASPLYNKEGSARVCKRDTIGGGKVGGNCKTVSLAKGSVVDESPWSVNGRSLKRPISEGSNSLELSASRVDFRVTSRAAFFGVPLAGAVCAACGGGVWPRFGRSTGNFFSPPGANASFTASSSGVATKVDALERLSFSTGRGGGPRGAGGFGGLSGGGSFGSGESEIW
jgi:hypothetical protein